MDLISTSIEGCFVIQPKIHNDKRGYFVKTFHKNIFFDLGLENSFSEDYYSVSKKGVLRGLHFQRAPYEQSKLIKVSLGKIQDVIVDLRQDSNTYGKWESYDLSSNNNRILFVPKGFAHGFLVLSKYAIFSYKVDNYYAPKHDRGIAFDDPKLGINWQLPLADLRLSDKDKKLPNLLDATDLFE